MQKEQYILELWVMKRSDMFRERGREFYMA